MLEKTFNKLADKIMVRFDKVMEKVEEWYAPVVILLTEIRDILKRVEGHIANGNTPATDE